jgi:hypothetical protein
VGVIILALSTTVILFYIDQIERIQADILSILALLNSVHIREVYNKCSNYMDELDSGSFLKKI